MCRWLNWIHTKWHKQGQCVSHCLRLTAYVDTVTLFWFWTIQHKHIRQSLFQWNREACFLSFSTITVVAETIGLSSKSAAERWDKHLDPTFQKLDLKPSKLLFLWRASQPMKRTAAPQQSHPRPSEQKPARLKVKVIVFPASLKKPDCC